MTVTPGRGAGALVLCGVMGAETGKLTMNYHLTCLHP